MLTRTVISPSTVEKIRMDPPTGKHMANYLRENGLLLINRDELNVLAEKLPNEIWIRLQDDIVKNRQARSPWIPGSEITQPEVALSESGSDATHGAISTQVDDYLETAPVARRLRLKSGEEKCRNREDFWLWQFPNSHQGRKTRAQSPHWRSHPHCGTKSGYFPCQS